MQINQFPFISGNMLLLKRRQLLMRNLLLLKLNLFILILYLYYAYWALLEIFSRHKRIHRM